MKMSFVIPAHNEEKNIGKTVCELQTMLLENAIPYEIIVVNDNSTDGTAEAIRQIMAENPCIRTVDREPPAGFGRAIRAGLELVQGDMVITYMADHSDDPKDALTYYRKIEEGYDCVYGSRFRKGSKVEHYPIVKMVVNRMINRIIQTMFWCKFNDLTNAFKAYRVEVISECGPYRSSHFNITIEMSLSALARDYHIAEIPIAWYGRTWGSSSLRLTEMGRRYLSTLLKVFFDKVLVSDDLMAERLAHQAKERVRHADVSRRLERLEAQLAALGEKLDGSR
jgi:dolichol-phosphate mannosyltransferase